VLVHMRLRSKATFGLLVFILTLLCAVFLGCSSTNTGSASPVPMAELSPHVPDGWPGPIMSDQESLSFKIAWTNQGNAMAEEYTIVLLIDGEQVAEWYKPVTAPGKIKTQRVRLKELTNPASLINSRHDLELIIDPQNTVKESNEGSNSFSTRQFLSFQLPDLEPHLPEDLSWDQPVVFGGTDLIYGISPPPPDGGYYMAYSVTNSGGAAAASWGGSTRFTVNGLSLSQAYINQTGGTEPQPGAFVIAAVPFWKIVVTEGPLMPGKHQVDWTIDGANSVLEVDEGNNSLSLEVEFPTTRDRTLFDQVDQPEEGENLVHLVYVLPSDGLDEKWDINGTIESIAASMQSWLRERSPVEGLRFDSIDGVLDITFVRLKASLTQISQAVVTSAPLMEGLMEAGLDDPKKIYAAWVPFAGRAGDLNPICGSQSDRDGVKFSFTFFERHDDPEPNHCLSQDTIMLHEVFHALGAVSPCAPNYLGQSSNLPKGHVNDDPNDLMYGGDELGVMIELDKDRDDYFGHGLANCTDLADSPFLQHAD